MTPVYFIKTLELYVRTTDSHEVTIWVVHLLEQPKNGPNYHRTRITALEQTTGH